MRKLAVVVGILAAALFAWVVAARSGALDSDPAEALARYGASPRSSS